MKMADKIHQIAGRIAKHRHLDSLSFAVSRPATEEEIADVEKRLGITIPTSLKKVFQKIGYRLELSWLIDEAHSLELEDEEIYWGGGVILNLPDLPELLKSWRTWATDIRPFWKGKFPFMRLNNGDMLAVCQETDKLVYLDHYDDEEETTSFVINQELESFLIDWIGLGCPGPESNVLFCFFKSDDEFVLDVKTKNAKRIVKYLKL